MFSAQIWAACFAVFCAAIGYLFNKMQPEPYMDEEFHIPQAVQYCLHNFSHWDPMITTPPGLYLSSLLWIEPLSVILQTPTVSLCTPALLRAHNIALIVALFMTVYWLLGKIHTATQSTPDLIVSSFNISMFPVLFFFTFLYYTDVGATLLVIVGYALSLRNQHFFAATALLVSVCFRQTSVVWIVFVVGTAALKIIEPKFYRTTKDEYKYYCLAYPMAVARSLLNNFRPLCLILWPYLLVVLTFLLFVAYNGSIVLGDKTHHQASLHLPQFFYFATFSCVFASSHLMLNSRLLLSFLSTLFRCWRWLAGLVALVGVTLAAVHWFTYAHPYLLADNRHYPFYLWKNIFRYHEMVKYALTPVYSVAILLVTFSLLRTQSTLWVLLYFVCCFVSLVPQQLIEFRYFILPYLIFRIHIPRPQNHCAQLSVLLELVTYSVINITTVYVFLYRPFHWSNSNKLQRFMW